MKKIKKKFVYDILLHEENICNLEDERKRIINGILKGDKILVYGKRNTGKTSLVKNVIIPYWMKKYPSGLYLYADLMGVKTLGNISERFTIAFNEAYSRSFNIRASMKSILETLRGIRPTISVGYDGNPTVSFTTDSGERVISFTDIYKQLQTIFDSRVNILIVLDEFQDISQVDQAEALLRDAMQNLSPDISIILMGSKQHMLSKIFSRPNAPFFNWGYSIEFGDIAYEEFYEYMNERFNEFGLRISEESSVYLQDQLQRSPEAINKLCSYILDFININKKEIKIADIDSALADMISSRQSEPELYLSSFSIKEKKVIISIAQKGKVINPTGKDFSGNMDISISGIRKIINKLKDEAVVYEEKDGIVLADPLLKHHILRYRI